MAGDMEALILVDLQNDFCPGGALPVKGGDMIVPLANRLKSSFKVTVATQDWHPPGHLSFASAHGKRPGEQIQLGGFTQILWPDHCVQNTRGAEFVPQFDARGLAKKFHKGTDPEIDSYSAFYDNAHRRSTGLGDYLRARKISTVYIAGLATDYCVKYSALDAVRAGFKTFVIADASKGVDLEPGDSERALDQISRCGVKIVMSNQCLDGK